MNATQDPPDLTPEQVRGACDAFLAAIDTSMTWLVLHREMVEQFKASGTLIPTDEMRERLDATEPDEATFATLDHLDAIRRGEAK